MIRGKHATCSQRLVIKLYTISLIYHNWVEDKLTLDPLDRRVRACFEEKIEI